MQTTSSSKTDIPIPILITLYILLIPCAATTFVLLAGPPEWREANWHALHVYTAIMLIFLSSLYGAYLWKMKLTQHQHSTMSLTIGAVLLAGISLILPALTGGCMLLVGFVGYKNALARQGEMTVRIPQWCEKLGDQFSAWAMIFLGIALGSNLL